MRIKVGMGPRQVENGSDLANQVIVGKNLFKTKRIKQLLLVVIEPPHHRPPPPRIASERRNHCSQKPSTLLQQNRHKADSCTAANASYSVGSIRASRRQLHAGAQNVKPKPAYPTHTSRCGGI